MKDQRIASFLCGMAVCALWILVVDYDPARMSGDVNLPMSRAAAVETSAPEWTPVRETADERSSMAHVPFAARGGVLRRMNVSAYCPGPCCCAPYADGITASGLPVSENGGRFAAGPPSMGFGMMVRIPGYAGGEWVPVLDRGGAIQGNKLDLFFPTHKQALAWGRKTLTCEIIR